MSAADSRASGGRALLALGLAALAAAVLLAGVHLLTRDRIQLAEDRRALATLEQLLAPGSYDNEPVRDAIRVHIPGLPEPATAYRARLGEAPAALLVDVTTPSGYSGDIRLLVGLTPDGTIIGVRVLAHRETPGLGDRIEHRRSDWLEQFRGARQGAPPDWRPDRRGGDFDTLSSATITSGAVIDALDRVLEWYARAGEHAFEQERMEP